MSYLSHTPNGGSQITSVWIVRMVAVPLLMSRAAEVSAQRACCTSSNFIANLVLQPHSTIKRV